MTAQREEQQEDSLSMRLEIKRLKEALQQAAWLANMDGDAPPEVLALQTEALVKEMLRRGAKRQADDREASETFRQPGYEQMPGTLASSLQLPRQPVRYWVDGLFGSQHNLSIEGMYKTGKTSLVAALCGALADGRPFLGFAAVTMPAGRIGIWNLEMDREDFEDYLDPEVADRDRIWVAHLRGHPLPFLVEGPGRKLAIEWLKAGNCECWVIDTWSKLCAWNGIDPLDNAAVARLTAALDEIKAEAGVTGLVVTSHMPHAAKTDPDSERAFGAQTFSGWVDEMWRYVRDKTGARFLTADGRKVTLAECQVVMDTDGMLRAVAGDRSQRGVADASLAITMLLGQGSGLTQNAIERDLEGNGRNNIRKALRDLISSGQVIVKQGRNNSHLHYLSDGSPWAGGPGIVR